MGQQTSWVKSSDRSLLVMRVAGSELPLHHCGINGLGGGGVVGAAEGRPEWKMGKRTLRTKDSSTLLYNRKSSLSICLAQQQKVSATYLKDQRVLQAGLCLDL